MNVTGYGPNNFRNIADYVAQNSRKTDH